jgi:hypothetical protein
MPLVEQELLSLPEHLSSPLVFSGIRVAQNFSFLYNILYILVCPFVLFLLAIVLSVLLLAIVLSVLLLAIVLSVLLLAIVLSVLLLAIVLSVLLQIMTLITSLISSNFS